MKDLPLCKLREWIVEGSRYDKDSYGNNMEKLDQYIESILPEIVDFRRYLHKHPEPAFLEVNTANAVVQRLKTIPGMEIQEQVGRTGVVALLGSEKPGDCIALRADMDCLRMEEQNSFLYASQNKGLMHACGHDGHTACLLGAALVISKIRDELNGPVKFIFQPAEENHGGAKEMLDDGALKNPPVAAIYGLHGTTVMKLGQIGLRAGASMAASKYFTITVKGKGCHAASPHRGIDPVHIGCQIVCATHSIISRNISPLDSGLISIPRFVGSSAPNVIPEEVILEGTLRALSTDSREMLETRLRELVESTARAHGGEASIEYYGGYPLLVNDQDESNYVRGIAEDVVGQKRVIWDFPPTLGAEDFAFFAEQVPASFFWLGLEPEGVQAPTLHHPCFDFNDEAIPIAIKMFCDLVRNYWKR